VIALPTFKTNKIIKALLSKGFQETDSNHKFFFFYYNGKKTAIRTKISHGKKEYDDSLINFMKKELYLDKGELEGLINCSLSETDYIKILKDKGKIYH